MRTIVVYYSLEGRTRSIATEIAGRLGAELLELLPAKAFPTGKVKKYVWGGKSAVFGETPKLATYTFDKGSFDCVVVCSPVWAGTMTPPVRTFLKENPIGGLKVGLVASSASGDGAKCLEAMRKAAGLEAADAELSFQDAEYRKAPTEGDLVGDFCAKLAEAGS